MLVVGLTGGIGSGKTTIAKGFAALGVPVYIADDASKKLLDTNAEVQENVKDLLGAQAYINTDKGEVADRKFIASKVFNDATFLNGLNAIMHPVVRRDFNNWRAIQTAPYILYEAAILLESGGYDLCDYIIVVATPLDIRIARVIERDNVTEQEVHARINNQWNDKKRLDYASFVIINEDIQKIDVQIRRVHELMLK